MAFYSTNNNNKTWGQDFQLTCLWSFEKKKFWFMLLLIDLWQHDILLIFIYGIFVYAFCKHGRDILYSLYMWTSSKKDTPFKKPLTERKKNQRFRDGEFNEPKYYVLLFVGQVIIQRKIAQIKVLFVQVCTNE